MSGEDFEFWETKYSDLAEAKIEEINHSLRFEQTDDPTAIFVAAKVFCAQLKRIPKSAFRHSVFRLYRDLIKEEMRQ